MPVDAAGHYFVEIETWREDDRRGYVRLTYIPNGVLGPSIRVQVSIPGEGLNPGPEIPVHVARQFMGAMQDMLATFVPPASTSND